MIKLAVFDNHRMAQAFVDYLVLHEILAVTHRTEGGVEILLKQKDDLARAQSELDRFMQDPLHRRYQAASWHTGDAGHAGLTYGDSVGGLKQQFLSQVGPFGVLILLICVGLYALSLLGWRDQLFQLLHFPATMAQQLEVWRFVTPAVLHFSEIHLLFNLLWWWLLGGVIERQLGSRKLLLLFLLSAVISNSAQALLVDPYFLGLSGVVYALMGYLWWRDWLDPQEGIGMPKAYVGLMLLWMLFGFLDLFGPPMANMAHLFGLIVGCTQAFFEVKVLRR